MEQYANDRNPVRRGEGVGPGAKPPEAETRLAFGR